MRADKATLQRCIRYMNETGHVQGLRHYLRDRILFERDAVNAERQLDAVIERAVEFALEEAAAVKSRKAKR